ncbi:MAG: transcriptional regulator NrdR [Patescibacteria group bacterium]|nr:transcriptional regulator NrdR [Patescibacteria group bacterium]
MFCPRCKNAETRVVDSRVTDAGNSVRRRRECEKCSHRFTTFERPEVASFLVVKRDNTRESYDRDKLEKGIWISCGKRPVSPIQISEMLNNLEEKWSANKREISSSRIGGDVMNELKKIDDIAYVRFASVYKSFKDIDEFRSEMEKLWKK